MNRVRKMVELALSEDTTQTLTEPWVIHKMGFGSVMTMYYVYRREDRVLLGAITQLGAGPFFVGQPGETDTQQFGTVEEAARFLYEAASGGQEETGVALSPGI